MPWIYRQLERRKIGSSRIAQEARKREVALIDTLLASEDSESVIGRYARKGLKRLPSSVYWQGLGPWGIRLFAGSQEQYHRSLNVLYSAIQNCGTGRGVVAKTSLPEGRRG